MKSIKIIGLPVVVSERSRIVLDRNIRTLYQIKKDDEVLMNITQGVLCISPISKAAASIGEKKSITIGRFNLPREWAKENNVQIGDFVYLVATDIGIIVCPQNFELVCIGGKRL